MNVLGGTSYRIRDKYGDVIADLHRNEDGSYSFYHDIRPRLISEAEALDIAREYNTARPVGCAQFKVEAY